VPCPFPFDRGADGNCSLLLAEVGRRTFATPVRSCNRAAVECGILYIAVLFAAAAGYGVFLRSCLS
jgi:hypothetical protein